MAKTSKCVPQKETPSSSKPFQNASNAATEEPLLDHIFLLAVAQMPNPIPELKEWVEGIVTQRPYSERLWREISKGRWEARNHGLPKDVEMRPPSADDNIYFDPPASKQDKEKKKRKSLSPSDLEKKQIEKRLVRKTKDASARELSSDSLNRLRDESEEEEEDSNLVARVRSGSELPQVKEAVEEVAVKAYEPGRVETISLRVGEADEGNLASTSQLEGNMPKEALGVIDLSGSPSFTDSMINEAHTLKSNLGMGAQEAVDFLHHFFDGLDSTTSEDASVLHHEAFLRYWEESKCFKARELAEIRDAYKLLNEKSQVELEAARKEHTELVEQVRRVFGVSDDESDSLANNPNLQVQNKLDVIEQLRGEVDAVKVKTEEWKKNMDRLASEKDTSRAQLASAEVQPQATKEKNVAQVKMIEGLQSQLSSAISGQENLAKELEVAKSEVIMSRNEADKKVAQLKIDVEATRSRQKTW
ncbi:uncharacterized protein [Nicotiana tomentosiformis]|uniref:uncharacterized protein n=1 Tax=Nicotiana tomentosiformis TaxID=4098 RepID=UPI00388C902D